MNYFAVILLCLPFLQGGKSSNPQEGSACQSEGGFPLHWLQNDGHCCRCYNGVVRCEDVLPCPQLPEDTNDCDIIDVCGCNWLICDRSETGVGESEHEGNEEESYDGENEGTELRRKRDVHERDTKINHRNAGKGKGANSGKGIKGKEFKGKGANIGRGIKGKKFKGDIKQANIGKGSKGEHNKINGKSGKGKNPNGGKGKNGKNKGKGKGASGKGVGSKGKVTNSATGLASTTGPTVSGGTALTTYDHDNDGDYNTNETGNDGLNGDSDSNETNKVRPSIHKNQARINPTKELKITYHNSIKESSKRKGKGKVNGKGGASKGGKGKKKGSKSKGGKQGKGKHVNKGKGKGSKANKKPKGKGSKGAKIDALAQPATTVSYNYNDNYAYPTGPHYDSNNYNDQNYFGTHTNYGNNGGYEYSYHDNHDNLYNHSNGNYDYSYENHHQNNTYDQGNSTLNSTGTIVDVHYPHDYALGMENQTGEHGLGGTNPNDHGIGGNSSDVHGVYDNNTSVQY